MDNERINAMLSDLLEKLASVEHERWSHWQRYIHGKCSRFGDDGALLIPGDLVRHWEEQIATPYEKLAENEKESDREQVRKYLPLIAQAFQDYAK